MSYVLDASVTCAWAFADEATPALDDLLDRAATTEVFVPPLWRPEVLNVLVQAARRGRMTITDVLTFWRALEGLRIRVSAYEPPADTVVELCQKYGLTAYDAQYLALAQWMNLPLATLDGPLATAARQEGVEVLGGPRLA
ncbi:MAG: type II toxin-antitoxin system VapC family toxin [Propionibacteriaceae bacterium]|jgi:predicted nucleic acid-binding protein|nr:type II toxin-antitoxin system VapC family toxin [Propionibacteriaceae bacterium]